MFTFKAPKKKNSKIRKRLAIGGSTTTSFHDDEDENDENDKDEDRKDESSSSDDEERRKLRRKKNMSSSRKDEESDEESDEEERRRKRRKKQKSSSGKDKREESKKRKKKKRDKKGVGGGGIMSFDFGEEEDDDEMDNNYNDRKKKKKKKKDGKKKMGGMGFGGAAPSLDYDDDDDDDEDDKKKEEETKETAKKNNDSTEDKEKIGAGSGSMYGKEQLEKLKSEQRIYVAPTVEKTKENDDDDNKKEEEKKTMNVNTSPFVRKSSTFQKSPDTKEKNKDLSGDYVPLSKNNSKGGNDDHILAGDEALSYHEKDPTSLSSSQIGSNKEKSKTTPLFGGIEKEEKEDAEVDEGVKQWEEEIERRAGITTAQPQHRNTIPQKTSDSNPIHEKNDENTPSSSSLASMKQSIIKTLSSLSTTSKTLSSTMTRRQNELASTQSELSTHTDNLTRIGRAFDYYQSLRLEMIPWVGALRELHDKIKIVEKSIQDLYGELGERREKKRRDAENDVVDLLREGKLLENVVGRQGGSDSGKQEEEEESKKDEFDRDLTSFNILARRRRRLKRIKLYQQCRERQRSKKLIQNKEPNNEKGAITPLSDLQDFYLDSENEETNDELSEKTTRRQALSDATQLVLQDVDDAYVDLKQFIHTFVKWKKDYKEDYESCFAYESLVDLMSVLVRAEFCDSLDLLGLQASEEEEEEGLTCVVLSDFCFYHDLKSFRSDSMANTTHKKVGGKNGGGNGGERKNENDILCILCRKVFIPHLLSLMTTTVTSRADGDGGSSNGEKEYTGGYDPFSSQQSRLISQFYSSILECLPENEREKVQTKVEKVILNYFRQIVYDMAIPVLDTTAVKEALINAQGKENGDGDDDSKERNEAVLFATMGQILKLKKLALNIMSYWVPAFLKNGICAKELAQFILMDVIAARILPILTTWKDILMASDGKAVQLETDIIYANAATPTTKATREDDNSNMEKTFLIEIWDAVKKAGWLDEAGLMLNAAPLRAAASVHGLL